jgi:hypothetical protein
MYKNLDIFNRLVHYTGLHHDIGTIRCICCNQPHPVARRMMHPYCQALVKISIPLTRGSQRNDCWLRESGRELEPCKKDIITGVREPDPTTPLERKKIGMYQNFSPPFNRSKRCCPCEPFQ